LVSFVDRHGATWVSVLLFIFFIFGFVGGSPLTGGAEPSTTGGSSAVRQILLLGLFVGSLPILAVYRTRVVTILRANILPLIAYGWLATTALWSMYPPLTLRRVAAEMLVLCLLVAAVSAMRSWRVLVYPVVAAGALIILADVAAVALVPGLAIGPIGAMGVHSNKNIAGVVTMIALITCGGTVLATDDRRIRLGLLPVIGLGFVFLVLTKSKTALGLTVLTYAAFPAFYLFFKRWSAAPAVVPIALVSTIALVVFGVSSAGITQDQLLEFVFGDATLTRRTELWAFLQLNIDQRPYLGWGWGGFWDTGAKFNPIIAPPQSWVLPATEINTAHSGYIDIWLQAGLVGLLITVVLVVRAIWVYARLLRQRHWGGQNDRLIATMFAVVVALALYNFLESIIFTPADCLNSLFILCLLAGETCYQQGRKVTVPYARSETLAPAFSGALMPRTTERLPEASGAQNAPPYPRRLTFGR
jgi:Lipid A core - O-antigen ligase and related enzymes